MTGWGTSISLNDNQSKLACNNNLINVPVNVIVRVIITLVLQHEKLMLEVLLESLMELSPPSFYLKSHNTVKNIMIDMVLLHSSISKRIFVK